MYEKSDKFNSILTAYAQGAYQNPDEDVDLMATFFPAIQVGTHVGEYDIRAIEPGYTAVDATLTRDNTPRRIQANVIKGYYNCTPKALEIASWVPALRQDNGDQIREDNLRTLMSAQFTTRQKEAADLVLTTTAASGLNGAISSNANADVVGMLETLCRNVVEGTGRRPSHLIMGHAAWNIIRNHPRIVDRISGLAYGTATDALLSMLSYGGITPVIVDSMHMQEGTLKPLLSDQVIALYNDPAPSRTDLSFGKEFTLNPAGPEVLSYTEHAVNEVDLLMWSGHSVIANPAALSRIAVS